MREIRDHRVNPANDVIRIFVTDAPGEGGASHRYELSGFSVSNNPASIEPDASYSGALEDGVTLFFQNGPIGVVGVNGITQEALLAICIDRLRSFQAGPYACRENAFALTKLEEAVHWLHARTLARIARGVEGSHEK